MKFQNIIGHDFIKKHLINSIKLGNVSHAYIFAGEDGIGKSLIADAFAHEILEIPDDRNSVDISEFGLSQDKLSIGISDLTKIIEEINKKPFEYDKKVIIIHDAHRMTTEAQNAFLKTIEEPPHGVFIMLLVENLDYMLTTIRSRCQIESLRRLNKEEMISFLKRDYTDISQDKIYLALSFSDGIPHRAELFLQDRDFIFMRDNVLQIIIESSKKNKYSLFSHEDFFTKYKSLWRNVLTCFVTLLRDAVILKVYEDEDLIINKDKISDIKEISNIFSYKKINDMIDIVNTTAERLDSNVNFTLSFDAMLLKFQEV